MDEVGDGPDGEAGKGVEGASGGVRDEFCEGLGAGGGVDVAEGGSWGKEAEGFFDDGSGVGEGVDELEGEG